MQEDCIRFINSRQIGESMDMKNEFGCFSLSVECNPAAGGYQQLEFCFKPSSQFMMHPRTMIEIVQFTRFFSNQFSLPQISDPTAPGYVIAKRSDGKFIDTVIRRLPAVYFRHGSTFHVIQLTLGEETLEKGGHITVVYGFRGAGGPGVKCPPLAKSYSFPVYISQRHVLGGSRFREEKSLSFESLFVDNKNVSTNLVKDKAVFVPVLNVQGNEAEKMKIIVSPRENDSALVTVNVMDTFGNLSPGANSWVMLSTGDRIAVKDGYGKAEIKNKVTGVQRISGTFSEAGIASISNPFVMGQNISWGEIHSHSGISDGLGTDRENYNSAINAGLDFGALSDHDTLMEADSSLWTKTGENAEKYNDEPDFSTILGYESLVYKNKEIAGHINIYYPDNDGIMESRPELEMIPDLCRKYNALAIPHHTMYGGPFFDQMGFKMEFLDPEIFDSSIMPVTEIYSTHGCSEFEGCERSVLGVKDERSVISALNKGFRWGFIGGSDNHESLLGSHFRVDKVPRTINNEHMQFRHGLTAAYVREFSRDGVIKALREKAVYATTGERILVSFTVNDFPMGSDVKYRNNGIIIGAEVSGTAIIKELYIFKNGEVLSSRCPETIDCSISFVDEGSVESGTYYYLKVIQTDGEMAWSSPVWIDTD